jgi:hypothetical protein
MKANLIKAIEDGTWETWLKQYTLDQWKSDMKNKAIPRISSGVDGEIDDMAKFGDQLISHINAGLSEIEKMPDMTLEDSLARVDKFLRHMAKFKRKP